jgi:predicted alpha/beta superfamily hydrolase
LLICIFLYEKKEHERTKMNTIKLSVIFLIAASTNIAQIITEANDVGNLFNTQVKIIHSTSVEDDFYLYISLPHSYEATDKTYPVLYILDGDMAYGMAASIARYLQFGGNIPRLIIVGIGYGTLRKEEGNMRQRDYSPTEKSGKDGITGGAQNFLNFLTEELFPYIDSTYRTDKDDKTMFGYSIAGLFGLYTLFNKPETFNGYIIGSPYLLWDNAVIFNEEEEASIKFKEIKARVFISVGSEESTEKYFNPVDELVTLLEEREYDGLILETKVFDGSTHLMGPPEAVMYGLLSVFSKEK